MDDTDPRGKTILIVDDDESILNLLELLVRTAGFKVLPTMTGEQAIAKLSEKPDAILLDLMMPGCGGLGVLEHLKGAAGPIPPVIVITAFEHRHPSVSAAIMDANVVQCLSKPVDRDTLLGAIHRYLKTEPVQPDQPQ